MLDHSRHVPLRSSPWSADAARSTIDAIVADALAHFDAQRFWPAHPRDDNLVDGHTSFYFGAAGAIWGLEYLRRVRATEHGFDFRPMLPRLLQASTEEFPTIRPDYAAHGSFLFGDLGTALVVMRLDPAPAIADLIHARAQGNTRLPVRELMWGMPGSMLACVHMAEMTGEPRWRALFEEQAARLLDELEETADGPMWTQDLYGRRQQWLGPVHGYAGNMIPLIRGWDWLTGAQRDRIADAVPRTLAANVWRSELGASWRGTVGRDRAPWLCQHCHGAPGMVTTFADAPFSAPELESLLVDGGRFTWAAGPIAKGSNLCHGTAGNGYAFLKLLRRTRDPIWAERARAFAMSAIGQWCEESEAVGRGRYSLWTGDVGLAIYLWGCLTDDPRFPTIDVL